MSTVTDNRAQSRYEMVIDGQLCKIDYARHQGVVNLLYVEVPQALNGKGHGAALVKGALELIAAAKEKAIPTCSFARAYFQRHPQYQHLLA